jgi:hypothetical protein
MARHFPSNHRHQPVLEQALRLLTRAYRELPPPLRRKLIVRLVRRELANIERRD